LIRKLIVAAGLFVCSFLRLFIRCLLKEHVKKVLNSFKKIKKKKSIGRRGRGRGEKNRL
jgi:hypothetical protein